MNSIPLVTNSSQINQKPSFFPKELDKIAKYVLPIFILLGATAIVFAALKFNAVILPASILTGALLVAFLILIGKDCWKPKQKAVSKLNEENNLGAAPPLLGANITLTESDQKSLKQTTDQSSENHLLPTNTQVLEQNAIIINPAQSKPEQILPTNEINKSIKGAAQSNPTNNPTAPISILQNTETPFKKIDPDSKELDLGIKTSREEYEAYERLYGISSNNH